MLNYRQIFAALMRWTDHEEFAVDPDSAERSASALDAAQALTGPQSSRPEQQQAIRHLLQALELDGRNPLPVILLVRAAGVYPHLAARTLSQAAKDALDWYDSAQGLPAAVAARRRKEALEVIAGAAPLLHAAGRYQDAQAVFLDWLRLAPKRAAFIRPWLASHALAVGDIFHVVEGLQAKDTQADGRFWCWVALLLNRLTRAAKSGKLLRAAMECEPAVADYLTVIPPAPGLVDQSSLVPGSVEEARFHAGLLHRAWASHPEHLQWLREQLAAGADAEQESSEA